MNSIIATMITSIILAFISKKVNVEFKSNTNSTKKFTIASPKTFPLILQCCAWIMLALMVIANFSNWIWGHEYDPGLLWFGVGFAVLAILASIIVAVWKMRVENDEFIYTSFMGTKKRTTFDKIDRVLVTDQGSYIIYASGKRFGTINRDFLGIDNFLARCKEENIEVVPKSKKYITKLSLYLKAMKAIIGISMVFTVIFFIVLVIINATSEKIYQNTFLEVLFLSFLPAVFILALTFLLPLRGIIQIFRQEAVLNFRFSEEMKENEVCGANFVNKKWFIDTSLTHIVAFRRDYIVELGIIEKASSGDNAKMKIHTVEGATVKASSGNGIIADLQNWFRSPPMK